MNALSSPLPSTDSNSTSQALLPMNLTPPTLNISSMNLPFQNVGENPVMAFSLYLQPESFVHLELKRESSGPTLVAHFTDRSDLSQIQSIPLELNEESLQAIQESQRLSYAYPCQIQYHALWETLYLVAYDTLWSIDLNAGTSQLIDWNDPEEEGNSYLHLKATALDVSHDASYQNRNNHPWIYSRDRKLMACATYRGEVLLRDRALGPMSQRVLKNAHNQHNPLPLQVRFGWQDRVLGYALGDVVEILDLQTQARLLSHSGTSFTITYNGLVVIVDGHMLRGFDLKRGVWVFHLPTRSISPHVHVEAELSDSIHLVHGSQAWKINNPLHKLAAVKSHELRLQGDELEASYISVKRVTQSFPKTTSQIIRDIVGPHAATLHHREGAFMIQSQSTVLKGDPRSGRILKTLESGEGKAHPLVFLKQSNRQGWLQPLHEGQVQFYKLGSAKGKPLLSSDLLDYFKLSQPSKMQARVEAHREEPSYDMYLRSHGYESKVTYGHHSVCLSHDHQHLITATSWDAVRVWDLHHVKVVSEFEIPRSEAMLGEAVAGLHASADGQSLKVIMQDGTIYHVDNYLDHSQKMEPIDKLTTHSRVAIAWVQHQRYALVVEGYQDEESWETSRHGYHAAPVLLDLESLTQTSLPELPEEAYSEKPLAICPDGHYLLLESTLTDGNYFHPGKHRVVDLQQDSMVISEKEVSFFTKTVSDPEPSGVFHLLTQDYELHTMQWAR